MNSYNDSNYLHTIVIGGGQAGLSVGYHLAKQGIPFVILDASARVGDSWRNRWDSLRLFTPSSYIGLPGLPFPRSGAFPTKDQMADYLETYAAHFRLPVRSGVRVDRLSRANGRFLVTAAGRRLEADNVVVAMADYQKPRTPSFAAELHRGIVQLHSHDYRNPWQLQDGGVLVVGVGNSGADIAIEVARTHSTCISGKESGAVPFPIETAFGRHILFRAIRFVGHHILTASTPLGRKLRPKLLAHSAPLVRVKPQDLMKAGVQRVARVVGVRDGWPLLEDGRTLQVGNVIWCTGYFPGFSWIDLPVFGEDGRPVHERGIAPGAPGMYFVGLHFLYAMSSATVIGVGRDAKHVVNAIQSRGVTTERPSELDVASLVAA